VRQPPGLDVGLAGGQPQKYESYEKMIPELKEADIQPVKKKREPRITPFWEGGGGV
jgi:hypothetical protein